MTEGSVTEKNYFLSLFSTIKNDEIEFLFFDKSEKEKGWSNPKMLMDYLQVFVMDKAEKLTFGEVKDVLFKCVIKNENNLDYSLFKRLFAECERKRGIRRNDKFNKEVFDDILNELKNTNFQDMIYTDYDFIVENIHSLLNFSTYDPSIDDVVLVVDRDKDSFSEKQYDYVQEKSAENNVVFIVTNPSFEFYLALHLSNCNDVNVEKMLDNPREDNGEKYSYNYLVSKDTTYTKTLYDVNKYSSNYKVAIKNAKLFEINIHELKNSIGTNLGEWIKNIIKN